MSNKVIKYKNCNFRFVAPRNISEVIAADFTLNVDSTNGDTTSASNGSAITTNWFAFPQGMTLGLDVDDYNDGYRVKLIIKDGDDVYVTGATTASTYFKATSWKDGLKAKMVVNSQAKDYTIDADGVTSILAKVKVYTNVGTDISKIGIATGKAISASTYAVVGSVYSSVIAFTQFKGTIGLSNTTDYKLGYRAYNVPILTSANYANVGKSPSAADATIADEYWIAVVLQYSDTSKTSAPTLDEALSVLTFTASE